jgi:hypothetical protein
VNNRGSDEEVIEYEMLVKEVNMVKENAPEYVKNVLRNHFKQKGS